MIDWSGCPLVMRREGYLGGTPALRDDPRVPPEIVVVNMDNGDSAKEVIEAYGLRSAPSDIIAVYTYAVRQRAPALGP